MQNAAARWQSGKTQRPTLHMTRSWSLFQAQTVPTNAEKQIWMQHFDLSFKLIFCSNHNDGFHIFPP